MKDPEHILLVRLSSVGDILLATPAAALLRLRYPRARITWLVDAGYLDLVRANPHIDDTMEFDYTGSHRGPGGIRKLADQLGRVDLLVDLQHKVRSLMLSAYLRPAQRRVLVKRRGFGIIKALVGQDAILGAPHQVERYVQVLGDDVPGGTTGSTPAPVLIADEGEREAAKNHLDGDDFIGIVAGARHRTKTWPVRHTAALADRCREEGYRVALLGGQEDGSLTGAVVNSMKTEPAYVRTDGSLGQLAGILSCCRAVVSPDSGPAHMAGALGVPVVAVFGPTSPDRWAPLGPRVRVVRRELACAPCSNHGGASCPVDTLECMNELEPEEVWKGLVDLLSA
jgi:lipopolysaccharide heptosyltransferase II